MIKTTPRLDKLRPLLLIGGLTFAVSTPAWAQSRVVGGQVSKECAFPAVSKPASPTSFAAATPSSTREPVQLCTGTLVHPRVVIYAAHCLKAGYLRFGENKNGPLFKASEGQIIKAATNPRWAAPNQVNEDWAYLVLKEPVQGVPLIPIAYGCELDMLIKPGAPVVLAGYSDNEKNLPEDQRDFRQKWGKSTIRDANQGVINAGGKGVAACMGDSGGPLLAQLPDGSWRTVGIASTRAGGACGSPTAYNRYSRVRKAMVAWLEKETGIDLTPCWDLDGNPTPSWQCDELMAYAGDPNKPRGSWSTMCKEAKVLPAKDACGIKDSGEEKPKDEGEDSGDNSGETSSGEDSGSSEDSNEDSSGNDEEGGSDPSETGNDDSSESESATKEDSENDSTKNKGGKGEESGPNSESSGEDEDEDEDEEGDEDSTAEDDPGQEKTVRRRSCQFGPASPASALVGLWFLLYRRRARQA